jgi:hypothetical protein
MPRVTADATRPASGGKPAIAGGAAVERPKPPTATSTSGAPARRPKPTTPDLSDAQRREFATRVANGGGSGAWLGGGENFETWFERQDQAKFMYALTHYKPENPHYESAPIGLLVGASQGTDGLTFDPRRAKPIADALRDAYRSGYVSADDLIRIVQGAESTPARSLEQYHADLGRLVAMTGEIDLIAGFAKLELEASDPGTRGAEEALRGLPPPTGSGGVDLVNKFVDAASPKAVGAMLAFSPRMSVRVFLGEPPDAKRGEVVLRSLLGTSGTADPRDLRRLSWFLGSRLFSGTGAFDATNFPNRDAARREIVAMMSALHARIESPSTSAAERKRAAVLLGSMLGSLEAGFNMVFESAKFNERVSPDELKALRANAASFLDSLRAMRSGFNVPAQPSDAWIAQAIKKNGSASTSGSRGPVAPFGTLLLATPKWDANLTKAFDGARAAAFQSIK